MLCWLASAALAAGLHGGVNLSGLPVLGQPVYASAEAGLALTVQDDDGGRVRIRVARDEAAAKAWFAANRARGRQGRTPPPMDVDEVAGDGHSFVVARDGNIAWMVERPTGAMDLALRVQERLIDEAPWPATPEVEVDGARMRVSGDWVHVTWQPAVAPGETVGESLANHTIDLGDGWVTFRHAPPRVDITAWDAHGRAVSVVWTAP